MPCSLEGIQSIQDYKIRLLKSTHPEKQDFMNAVFDSARGRVMHGWPGSTMPEGQQNLKEEIESIDMIESIVKQFANPSYVKPSARIVTPKPDERVNGGNGGHGQGEDTEMKDVTAELQLEE